MAQGSTARQTAPLAVSSASRIDTPAGVNEVGRRILSTESSNEQLSGYARALIAEDLVFVAGTTGYRYPDMDSLPEDVVAQAKQIFANIERALAWADCRVADIVRIQYYLTDKSYWPILGPHLARFFAPCRAPATTLICELVDPAMKVEIEVTARRSRDHDRG
jgi:enamine deaminase RidA (YjgF/YER057c/UK114 family)